MQYQMELKQIVNFPRCRIYRQFIRNLAQDRNIRLNGCSYLFHYVTLCSYANFRTSYCRIDGIGYTAYPGEWICHISEIADWFRFPLHCQAIKALDNLSEQNLITYHRLGRGKIIKFKITDWQQHNTVLDYNAPCQKDSGFFFIPISIATELISIGKCSEMDRVLDLWINTIYNDEQVQGSNIGPVVYMRNGSGSPLVSYAELGLRWGTSKSTVSRFLKCLEDLQYISLMTFPGTTGSAIYLQNYLSTMFQISDVLVDKDEVAMTLNIKINSAENKEAEFEQVDEEIEISVSKENSSVAKPDINLLAKKIAEILSMQGFNCFGCKKVFYKLSPLLNACKSSIFSSNYLSHHQGANHYLLSISCANGGEIFRFELALSEIGLGE